jgi:hypothetical protein
MDIIFNVESGEARKRGKPLNGVDFKARTPVHLKYKREEGGTLVRKNPSLRIIYTRTSISPTTLIQ